MNERINPFFEPYNTVHDTVPFDRIRTEDFEEAFVEGMKREKEEIDKIVNNPEEPTFDNTIIYVDTAKGEHYYDLLDRVSNVFSCLLSAETNDELDELAQKMSPLLTKHANDISLNRQLFERTKQVYEHHRELTAEEQRLLDDCYDGFVRSGALLDEDGKAQLRKLTEEAGLLTLQFSQNVLKENKAFQLHLTNEDDLDGLPETAREAAAMTAKENGCEGWVVTLDAPSYGPFMTYSTRRELRQQLYMARNTVCTHDNEQNNFAICTRLVNLRREMAQLLGYETYADYVLKHRMASTTANVYKLLDDLIDAYKPTALDERKEVVALAKRMEGEAFKMQPWDGSFYSHKLKMERFNIDAEMLRPYLQLEKVIDGVFGLATRLYGITFKENKDIPVYHPDVKAYDVLDRDGTYLAVFYADFFPRKGKQSGAWMTEFRSESKDDNGNRIIPLISIVCNFSKPVGNDPVLLNTDEVETFLHEFGHALHGLSSQAKYNSLAGTNVDHDFVELFSQFNENYLTRKEFLDTFAKHYKTGKKMPQALIDKLIKSSQFGAAYATMRQLGFGYLDMAYHTIEEPLLASSSVKDFEEKALDPVRIFDAVPENLISSSFSHIFSGGYAAGYYGYKWSEALDADAFAAFKENGVFDRKTADKFLKMLQSGDTKDPMELYVEFRGKQPNNDALLERDGIKASK